MSTSTTTARWSRTSTQRPTLFAPERTAAAVVCVDDEWGRTLAVAPIGADGRGLVRRGRHRGRRHRVDVVPLAVPRGHDPPDGTGQRDERAAGARDGRRAWASTRADAARALADGPAGPGAPRGRRRAVRPACSSTTRTRPTALERVLDRRPGAPPGEPRSSSSSAAAASATAASVPLMGAIASSLADAVDRHLGQPPGRVTRGDHRRDRRRAATAPRRCGVERGPRPRDRRRRSPTPRDDDVVLLAGKGHETTQEIAGELLPFDDRRVAAEALARRGPTC